MTFITDVKLSTVVFISSRLKRFWATPTPVSFNCFHLTSIVSSAISNSLDALSVSVSILLILSVTVSRLFNIAATICPCRLPAKASKSPACCLSVKSWYIFPISSSNCFVDLYSVFASSAKRLIPPGEFAVFVKSAIFPDKSSISPIYSSVSSSY